jgi:BirA family transcriptional regulator, biotin operon repressor / biotin---[acetyl-CoA-carboxylase] ligase
MQFNKIIKLQETASTNNYARGQVLHKQADEGTVFLAQYQTQGRGAGTNLWESERGKNLTFSVVFTPIFLNPAKQFYLSMVVSLGIFDFLASETSEAKIKWPNDVYIGKKKAGGILMEHIIQGSSISATVAGIGVNLNQETFTSHIPNPVSLKAITGKEYNLEDCLNRILEHLFKWYDSLKRGDEEKIYLAYLSHLFQYRQWATYRSHGTLFRGMIVGLDPYGCLQIQSDDGTLKTYQFKEVVYCSG